VDQSARQESSVIITFLKNRTITILLPLLTLFLGLVVGVVAVFLILPQQEVAKPQKQEVAKPQISQQNLPISLELLQNPIVYEWRGGIKGKVVDKDEHTLTLEDEKGNKITVTDLLPSGSGVFKTTYLKKAVPRVIELTLNEIPLGTTFRGEFFIFKNFPDTPIGGVFTIVE